MDTKRNQKFKYHILAHIEEQTTQWPKEKVQKGKHRSTKHTYKTKDRVTRTPLSTGDELVCSGRVSCTCSTSDTRHANLATNSVISHEWGKDREMFTSGTILAITSIMHICNVSRSCTSLRISKIGMNFKTIPSR